MVDCTLLEASQLASRRRALLPLPVRDGRGRLQLNC